MVGEIRKNVIIICKRCVFFSNIDNYKFLQLKKHTYLISTGTVKLSFRYGIVFSIGNSSFLPTGFRVEMRYIPDFNWKNKISYRYCYSLIFQLKHEYIHDFNWK
jgi:hypothetical protein